MGGYSPLKTYTQYTDAPKLLYNDTNNDGMLSVMKMFLVNGGNPSNVSNLTVLS